jgi:aldehyde dehydrogenase (NAD+)
MLGEICQEVLPLGDVNVVTGLGEVTGDALVRHSNVKRLASTDLVETGMVIHNV